MKVVAVLVAVACFSVSVEASNVICGAKTTSKSVTVEDVNTFSFKTQKGRKYKGNTECTVDYKMGDTCAKMSFVCTKFNTNNKDKRRCSKGDKVTVTANGKSKAYCKTKKPKVVSTGDMSVVFTSDTKKHGTGAVCKVKCTEAAGGGTGILIAGGSGASKSTEVFLPDSGKTCKLAALPNQRWYHTLDNVRGTGVLCGGGPTAFTERSCLQFSQSTGTWTGYATTQKKREGHASWVTKEGLLLMGGWPIDSTEIVKSGSSGSSFRLVNGVYYACSIQLGPYTIITGGVYSLTDVTKYSLKGWVENLPRLLQERSYHACGSYREGGDRILVVAGGWYTTLLSTTEVHRIGSSGWNAGQPLPRAMSGMASVSIDQGFIILGGRVTRKDGDHEIAEILFFKGANWTELGQLGRARSDSAATLISVDPTICE